MKKRIQVVDSLRGFSLLGILIIHCILHFCNFPRLGDIPVYNVSTDDLINYLALTLIAGKAQGIFALLFGLSFYIQNNNQLKKENNFTFRFLWRMILLFIFGCINGMFFLSEILIQFSILGLLLPFINRLKTKYLLCIGSFLLICPMIWLKFIYQLNGMEYIHSLGGNYSSVNDVLRFGDFKETFYTNFRYGNIVTLYSRFWFGNTFFLFAMFLFGLIIGRKQLFLYSSKNKTKWITASLLTGILSLSLYLAARYCIFINYPISCYSVINNYFSTIYTFFVISTFIFVYYSFSSITNILSILAPFGRMSLTVYFTQSVVGSFLYYNWGLNIGKYVGATYSLLIALGIFIIQLIIANLWFKYFKQGPLEFVWRKLTFIKV